MFGSPRRLAVARAPVASTASTPPQPPPRSQHQSQALGGVDVATAAAAPADKVIGWLATSTAGLTAAVAASRLAAMGPNAVRSHRASAVRVLANQVRSPLLGLLAVTATASFLLGERADAVIIGAILAGSVSLGFANEFRAAKAAQALHSQLRHVCACVRDGLPTMVDVTGLVAGDIVELELGAVVPADVRLVSVAGLECDESVLTGESLPQAKQSEPVAPHAPLAELTSCALMGTVVAAGSARGVVVATGGRAEFGRIALGLGEQQPETAFQIGLRRFSLLLVKVASVLTVAIFVTNLMLHRPVLDSLLFSLAVAVGISPQLLPAVVSTSLAAGSRQLAKRRVLVKRLVSIEDLGNLEVLFTDKTGTLTEGRISYLRAVGADGTPSDTPLLHGLLCNEAVVEQGRFGGANPLDAALWDSPAARANLAEVATRRRLAVRPFDHDRRLVSVLVSEPDGHHTLISKGAPESVLSRCVNVSDEARRALDAEFAAGNRVVAVAVKPADGLDEISSDDERELRFEGFLIFLDAPKPSAANALTRLRRLGVNVKVVTGDNPVVATRVCEELGLAVDGSLTGPDVDALSDEELRAVITNTTVFARVSPANKERIVRAERQCGKDVAFLGDGVNDALALHAADVGISVDSAADVAKDSADIILLDKDLDVLADGVVEGRRIFANTLKYVLMGTSSNFGNMFSAAGASAFLTFLPMIPSQILLNNLIYDTSQLAIPTDVVDDEQLARPAHWDVSFIRRFMLVFGPLSSIFDFVTFGVMLWVFHAHAPLFRSGWFVESLATQVLVVFVIRTRRSPFFRSRPSKPLLLAALGAVLVGGALPAMPFANDLGFAALPADFFAVLAAMVACYLALIDFAKRWFFAHAPEVRPTVIVARHERRTHRRAARFSTAARLARSIR
jgi:Mg2+-importing ATPase